MRDGLFSLSSHSVVNLPGACTCTTSLRHRPSQTVADEIGAPTLPLSISSVTVEIGAATLPLFFCNSSSALASNLLEGFGVKSGE